MASQYRRPIDAAVKAVPEYMRKQAPAPWPYATRLVDQNDAQPMVDYTGGGMVHGYAGGALIAGPGASPRSHPPAQ